MTETPIYTNRAKGGMDLITLCLIIALVVAFAPWTKAFATEDISSHWTRAHQLSLQGSDQPYQKTSVRRGFDISDAIDGTALEAVAKRVIETEQGTAIYLWKTSEASSINLFQTDGDGTGVQFSMKLN